MLSGGTDVSSHLPEDPLLYYVPNSDEIIRFYNYGFRLPRRDVMDAIVRANRAIAMHGSTDEPIPDHILRYGSNEVFLLMHQRGRLTWRAWETALQGIAQFVERYEFIDMDFDVGKIGKGQFYGTGTLGMMRN